MLYLLGWSLLAQVERLGRTLDHALIVGVQPNNLAGGPMSRNTYKEEVEVGARFMRFTAAATPHSLYPNPILRAVLSATGSATRIHRSLWTESRSHHRLYVDLSPLHPRRP
jgi:hypothetical protein